MKYVYLDNASTTPLHPDVVKVMSKILAEDFGNPSSTHSFGRNSKNILELCRKSIAKQFNAAASEIIFTSCATEANNFILRSAVRDLQITRIITSEIEHHAVLHTAIALQKEYGTRIDYVKIKASGEIDLNHLVELLAQNQKTLVSLMHVNNETGTILDLGRISQICKEHQAIFHSDTVQSIGKIKIDLQQTSVDFIVGSAHKFHGPKGIGFAFARKNSGLQPQFYGGEQEKGQRPGTEAIHQIAGMAKALELSCANMETESHYIASLKEYTIDRLRHYFPGTAINGENTLYNLLNVALPFDHNKTPMLLFHLDMKGIAVSRGSACQSGSIRPSHVLAAFLSEEALKKPSIRISFSHFNTKEEIDQLVEALKSVEQS